MVEFKESKFYKLLQDFFINNDKETFIQFLAEFYNRTEGIIDKNINQDELIKELRELYIKFNEEGIDENIVREKVNYFLENSLKIKDIKSKLNTNTNNIKNINLQLDTIENNKADKTTTQNLQTQVNNLVLQSGNPEASSAEIEQARGGFAVLNDRLNSMYEKNVVKNIIKNSALNNTDNWSKYGCSISAENGILTVVGTEKYGQVRNSDISVNYGDKLYIRCGVNTGSNSNIKIEVVEQYSSEVYLSLNCSSKAGLNFYSGVGTITKTDIIYSMFRVINYENSSVPFQVTKPLMVNLTKVFGKGNEPSAYEFEKMLSELYFEKTYIDNFNLMKKIDNTKRVITNIIENETQIKWLDGNNNMMLVFKPCGVNNLPQIKDLYKNNIKILDGNTDFISPIIVAGESQFAGDKTESFEFTGGYHGYNGDGTGTPTARNISYKVETDNNKCKIIVVNNIQGFNTKKVDGTGKEILQEEIIYNITPGKVNVDVKLTALEWCRISAYMGLQAQNTPWEDRILICDDDTHKQWIKLAYQNINGGNKLQSSCNKLILNKDNDYLEMKIDNSYGLGKLRYVSDSSPLMWCADYNKTYFNLVKDKDLTLTKNDVIYWSGEYKIYSI